MASSTPPTDLTEQTDDALIAGLGNLNGRVETAINLITELRRRDPNLSLREISRRSGLAYPSVRRWWAGRADA